MEAAVLSDIDDYSVIDVKKVTEEQRRKKQV